MVFRVISRFLTLLLFIPFLSLHAQERVYFRDGSNDRYIHIATPDTGESYAETIFYDAGSVSIESILYDPVGKRIFFVDNNGSGREIKYLYDFDPKSSVARTVFSARSRVDAIIKFTLDPASEIVSYLQDETSDRYLRARHVQSTSDDVYNFDLGTFLNPDETLISITSAHRGDGSVFFSTFNSSSESTIWFYDGSGSPEKIIFPGISNEIEEMRFEPTSGKLFALSAIDQNVIIHTMSYKTDTTSYSIDSSEEIHYNINGHYFNAFDFLYENTLKLILGSDDASFDLFEDSATSGTRLDLSELTLKLSNGYDPRSIGIRSACTEDSPDFDGDTIPDCKDLCPEDINNQCESFLYVSNIDPGAENIERIRINPAVASGINRLAGRESILAGLFAPGSDLGIDQFEVDEESHILTYVEFDTSGEPNHVLKIDYITGKQTDLFTLTGQQTILDLAIDKDDKLGYLLVYDDNITQYRLYEFDYSKDSQTPTSLSTISPTSMIGGITIDPTRSETKDKFLYYSFGSDIIRVNLHDLTEENVIDSNFFPACNLGDLAYNHNDDVLYAFCRDAGKSLVYRVSADGISQQPELLLSDNNQSVSNNTLVKLYYHSHINNGNGRLYLAFGNATDEGLFYFDNLSGSCNSNFCLERTNYFASEIELGDIAFLESCKANRSLDYDLDGTSDCIEAQDQCPLDPLKTAPGICGCGNVDIDIDNDGFCAHEDSCDTDPSKTSPGVCGCGIADVDADSDGFMSCSDACDNDPLKSLEGICGCNVSDFDTDNDGSVDCIDQCPINPVTRFAQPCGCDVSEEDVSDSDGDERPDCNDACIDEPSFHDEAPLCGCNVEQDTGDDDADGIVNCHENCSDSTLEGCGCGIDDCSSIDDGDVFLTERSTLSNAPSHAKHKKRSLNIFLKKFAGAKLVNTTNSRIAARKRKGKKGKKRDAKLSVKYEVIIKKVGKKSILKRILTNKTVLRVSKLKNGTYTVRYKAVIKRKKKTESTTNYSPSSSFRVPLP